MKSKMHIEQDDEQYRDVRVDFAPSNDFTKEVYTVRLSLDKEFGMVSESDWMYVASEGATSTELDNDPPPDVLAAYAAVKEQAESLAEKDT